ncbi:hypothetical protein [Rhodalgimonas zhirmunskyi]|uniref:Uncharacterized protein n=1 Tax=Rhodalgimonas zhirmunskyi TaxID=2964767 RepID=A0AAJ1UAA8_9RHOB|nr:hypothetical protein [Rhodoalgimonas zhirmunskyi]MDQ2094128.1 hypothetical protein [Rhodoalgimonas zhirmunskyi]
MMEACHFKMPAEMARQMIEIARERDVSVGQILRDLIAQEIERAAQGRSPLTPEQRRFEALRVDLMPDVQASESWQALQARLRAKGYEMRLDDNVLALHSYPKGHRTCLASDLGLAHEDLSRRMGEAFPGRPDPASAPTGMTNGPASVPPPAASYPAPQTASPHAHETYAPQSYPQQTYQQPHYPPELHQTDPYAAAPAPGHHAPQHTPHQVLGHLAMSDAGPHVNHGAPTRTAPGGLHLSEPVRAPASLASRGTPTAHRTPQQATPATQSTARSAPNSASHSAPKPAGPERNDPRLPPSWLTAARTAAE